MRGSASLADRRSVRLAGNKTPRCLKSRPGCGLCPSHGSTIPREPQTTVRSSAGAGNSSNLVDHDPSSVRPTVSPITCSFKRLAAVMGSRSLRLSRCAHSHPSGSCSLQSSLWPHKENSAKPGIGRVSACGHRVLSRVFKPNSTRKIPGDTSGCKQTTTNGCEQLVHFLLIKINDLDGNCKTGWDWSEPVRTNFWLPPRDSNPDMLIQSQRLSKAR